jgi:hypothetical protein
MSDAPLLLDSYPILVAGLEGERHLRPSEKKHEAKDLNKFLQKGAASIGRIAQPSGMVLGGGMGDYAMRGRDVFDKKLVWPAGNTTSGVATTATPASCSVVRGITYPIGAMADVSASWDVKDVAQPCAQGIPIMVTAIQRAKGAFTYEHDVDFTWTTATSAAALTVQASYYVSDGTNGVVRLPKTHGTVTQSTTTAMGAIGFGNAKVRWRFSPPDTADVRSGAQTINAVKYRCTIDLKYSGVVALTSGAAPVANASFTDRQYGAGYIPINDDQTTIWLDLCLLNQFASTLTDNYYSVFSSRGITLAGHDGYPYNYAIGNS